MNSAEFFRQTGVSIVRKFLSENFQQQLDLIIAETRSTKSQLAGASKYDNVLDEEKRNSLNLFVPNTIREKVVQRFLAFKPALEEQFKLNLGELEFPQFLLYLPGQFFAAHRDKSTKEESHPRRVSLIVFLNNGAHKTETDSYQGGELMIYHEGSGKRHGIPILGVRGSLVAFRSEVMHEVKPVTSGKRYTIASWFH